VKLPDVNVIVYAYDSDSPMHELASEWLEEALSGSETIALPWAVTIGFIRVVTNRAIFASPWEAGEAIEEVEAWLAQPSITVVDPTDRHPAVLRDLLTPLGTAGNLVSDAHLAALAIEHGATLCSCDNDFSRFAGVRWEDPLRG
jgi:toxin-antitoxin system PIN domain toxin